MILRIMPAVHDCRSPFSSSKTAPLQANSINAKTPNNWRAAVATALNQEVRAARYWSSNALGALAWAMDNDGSANATPTAATSMNLFRLKAHLNRSHSQELFVRPNRLLRTRLVGLSVNRRRCAV